MSAILAAIVLAGAAARTSPAMSDVALPGGVAAAHRALGDRTSPNAALFLAELVERFYNTPKQTDANQDERLQAFLAYLERSAAANDAPDPLPLPATPEWWIERVLGGTATPRSLVLDILRSRDAALLYRGLVSLDAPAREWLTGQPALVREIAHGRAAQFVLAGPGIRVNRGRLVTPGGERTVAAWNAWLGFRTDDPVGAVRRVLEQDEGMLAYFYGRMGRLPDGQVASVLTAPSGGEESLARTYRVFRRAAVDWRPATRPFSAMPADPSLLIADLPLGQDDRITVPGDEAFWHAVFGAQGDPERLPSDTAARPIGGTTDVSVLLEQVYANGVSEARTRSEQVRFAGRILAGHPDVRSEDAMVAVVAVERMPALPLTIERMGITDPAVYREAAARAFALEQIRDPRAQARSTAQFQGAIALVLQACRSGRASADEAARLVTAVSRIEPAETGDYDGRLFTWIERELLAGRSSTDPAPADLALVEWATSASSQPAAMRLTWEGTRYRVDPGYADRRRIEHVRGEYPSRDLSGVPTLLAIADRVERRSASDRRADIAALDDVMRVSAEDAEALATTDHLAPLADEARDRLRRRDTQAGALAVRRLADGLVARGLAELAYATSLGGSDGRAISSAEAARRHDLGVGRVDAAGMPATWQLPTPAARARGPWHLEGALLALDMTLAESWLRRRSERPLAVAPTMDRNDRRALAEVVPLMRPAALPDRDLERIAQAIRRGRERLASATPADLEPLARSLPLDALRNGVWGWALAHDRTTIGTLAYLRDLLILGDNAPWPDAWGAPVRPRVSAFRLEFPTRPPDIYMGHLSSGILMSAVPDLNLRVAELLETLHMPAALLPGVLASATMDVIDGTPTRYPDDLRSVAERAQSITLDDVEQYLAMLTTDGPLVPEEEGRHTSSGGAR